MLPEVMISQFWNVFTNSLSEMSLEAKRQNIQGVSIIGCFRRDFGLISRGIECGIIFDDKNNYLAVAYTKISEMCDTFVDSGSKKRGILHGELGYIGGSAVLINDILYVAAFSGGPGDLDLIVAQAGIRAIYKQANIIK